MFGYKLVKKVKMEMPVCSEQSIYDATLHVGGGSIKLIDAVYALFDHLNLKPGLKEKD